MSNDQVSTKKRFGSIFRFKKAEEEKNTAAKAPVTITLDRLSLPIIAVADNLRAEEVTCSDGRRALRLSAGNPSAFSGARPDAFSVLLPDSFEREASGNRVRVSVLARAASPGPSADFAVSYSTNEVGNSGWIKQTVGSRFETKSFEWPVPRMNLGQGDYVGILPAPAGECGIEVASLEVAVLPSK